MTLVGFKARNHNQQVALRGADDTVDERITPHRIFRELDFRFRFTLNVAANARNAKCKRFQQNAQREKVQAEITVIQAKAKADAVVTQATADADATKLRGEAEASAIRAEGDALKDNPGLVALTQAERWNGALPTTMVPGGAMPMLNLPAEH